MRIASIVGARPQFIKAFAISSAIKLSSNEELLIHTDQHYDYRMSQIFFEDLGLRALT
jgi:UDP-N-acetylglucosamine 2-epimerase